MRSLVKGLVVSALALGATGTGTVWAGDLDVIFGNTVALTVVAGGREMTTKYYYNADGTVTTDGAAEGTWEARGDEFCQSLTDPQSGQTRHMCNPLEEMTVAQPGDTWQFSPSEGITIKGEIVAGR